MCVCACVLNYSSTKLAGFTLIFSILWFHLISKIFPVIIGGFEIKIQVFLKRTKCSPEETWRVWENTEVISSIFSRSPESLDTW